MWELRRVAPALALLSAACALSEPAPLRPAAEIAAERPALAEAGIDWSDGLTPDEAARLAALRNPQLRAAREARGEAAAELEAAGMLSDLVLGGARTSSLGLQFCIDRQAAMGSMRRSRCLCCSSCCRPCLSPCRLFFRLTRDRLLGIRANSTIL
jgi:hypothetical protein